YVPDAAARALTLGRTGMIGVVVPDLANPYYSSLTKFLSVEADRADYETIIGDSNLDAGVELSLCIELSRRVDGLVLVSPRMPDASVRWFVDEAVSVVFINRMVSDDRLS